MKDHILMLTDLSRQTSSDERSYPYAYLPFTADQL